MSAFTVRGGDHLEHLRTMHTRFWPGLRAGAEIAGQTLVRRTQSGMQAAGGGKLYPGRRRQSGAPGGYPAVQSGQLLESIDYEIQDRTLTFGSRGAFNRGFDYAVAQQTGTSRMAARPYLTLTVNGTGHTVGGIIARRVWRAILGGG